MKVLPLPCKWLDLRVAQMTTKNGESSIHNEYFLARYIDTLIKYLFFLPDYLHSLPPVNGP